MSFAPSCEPINVELILLWCLCVDDVDGSALVLHLDPFDDCIISDDVGHSIFTGIKDETRFGVDNILLYRTSLIDSLPHTPQYKNSSHEKWKNNLQCTEAPRIPAQTRKMP
jgi:hypothetical protein